MANNSINILESVRSNNLNAIIEFASNEDEANSYSISLAFLLACRQIKPEIIEFLIDKVPPSCCLPDGQTGLMLIAAATKPNIKDAAGQSDFEDRCTSAANNLLEHNCQPELVDFCGRSALHLAALHGKPDIVRLLIKKHCNVNSVDQNGFTPLMNAVRAEKHSATIIHLLWHAGADPLKCTKQQGTSLHVAVRPFSKDTQTCRQGNMIDEQKKREQSLRKLLSICQHIQPINHRRETPFHLAIKLNNYELIKIFLEEAATKKLDVDLRSGWYPQYTPLEYACSLPDNYRIVKALLEADCNPNAAFISQSYSSVPPSAITSSSSSFSAIVHPPPPMTSASSISSSANSRVTALSLALGQGEWRVADLLISSGANTQISCSEQPGITRQSSLLQIALKRLHIEDAAATSSPPSAVAQQTTTIVATTSSHNECRARVIRMLIDESTRLERNKISHHRRLAHLQASLASLSTLCGQFNESHECTMAANENNTTARQISLEALEKLVNFDYQACLAVKDSSELCVLLRMFQQPSRAHSLLAFLARIKPSLAADLVLWPDCIDSLTARKFGPNMQLTRICFLNLANAAIELGHIEHTAIETGALAQQWIEFIKSFLECLLLNPGENELPIRSNQKLDAHEILYNLRFLPAKYIREALSSPRVIKAVIRRDSCFALTLLIEGFFHVSCCDWTTSCDRSLTDAQSSPRSMLLGGVAEFCVYSANLEAAFLLYITSGASLNFFHEYEKLEYTPTALTLDKTQTSSYGATRNTIKLLKYFSSQPLPLSTMCLQTIRKNLHFSYFNKIEQSVTNLSGLSPLLRKKIYLKTSDYVRHVKRASTENKYNNSLLVKHNDKDPSGFYIDFCWLLESWASIRLPTDLIDASCLDEKSTEHC